MLRKLTVAASAVLVAGLLAGCVPASPAKTPEASATPTATAQGMPTLKVPESVTGTSAQLMVNGGKLEKGTKATVYRFGGGWDDSTPVTCDDPNAETREIVINGDGNDQSVPFPVAPGVVSWVLVAGDFTTPCGGAGSQTRVLITTAVAVYVGAAGETTAVGQAKTITIDGTKLPATIPVTATVKVIGPWKNLPEVQAAGCGDDVPVASSTDVAMTDDINKVADKYDTTFTPKEAGVYRVIAILPETAQSTAVDTCADDSKPITFVVTGG